MHILVKGQITLCFELSFSDINKISLLIELHFGFSFSFSINCIILHHKSHNTNHLHAYKGMFLRIYRTISAFDLYFMFKSMSKKISPHKATSRKKRPNSFLVVLHLKKHPPLLKLKDILIYQLSSTNSHTIGFSLTSFITFLLTLFFFCFCWIVRPPR